MTEMNGIAVNALIDLVAARPAIWNKKDQNHSCRLEITKCWTEISSALKIDENVLRKKWKYLRDQYCVKLGEVQTSQVPVTPKWRHYKSLGFLKSTVTARSQENEDSDNVQINDESSSDYFERLTPKHDRKKKRKLEKEKNKKKTNEVRPIRDADTVFDKYVVEDEDEHMFFFKSLIPHVRKIPQAKLLSFRGRIQSVVEDFAYAPNPTSTEFVPEFPITIKGSPPRYSSEASDPIDTSG